MKRLLLFLLLAIPGACYGDSELLWNYRIGSGILAVDMSADGEYTAAGTFTSTTAGYGYGVYLFDRSGNLLWKYNTEDVVSSVSISDDGEYITAGSNDNHAYLFDKSGELLWKYKTDDTVWTVEISSDGEYIAAGSYDNNVYLFDKSGELLWKYRADDIVLSTSISSDGEYIAAGSYDNNVYLFDKSGELLWKYRADDVILSTSISSDGEYIAAGSYDNNVYLFDKSGTILWKYRTNNVVVSTSISSDGEYIAAGSYDNNVYLFDKSGELSFKYMTKDEVWDVAISSDGSHISAASRDFNVYFFSPSGDLLGKYRTGEYTSSVAVSETGDYAVAGSYDRSIYFFRIITVSPPEPGAPELDVSKTVTKSSIREGESATVLIELKNVGEATTRDIAFEDVIPEDFVLVAGELSHVLSLSPEESKTFSYIIKPAEIKEQKEVELPPLEVSYSDIKGRKYTAASSPAFIELIPESTYVPSIGLRERLGAAVSSISKFGITENLGAAVSLLLKLILVAIAALLSLTIIKAMAAKRKTRRKIDKAEILLKIKKEVGATELVHSEKIPGTPRRAPRKDKDATAKTKPGFSKPTYRREKVNLLKSLKREVKK